MSKIFVTYRQIYRQDAIKCFFETYDKCLERMIEFVPGLGFDL